MVELAINRLFQADFEGMDGWAGRALAAAEPLDDRALTATALAMQAAGAAMVGDSQRGLARRADAAEVIDALPDAELGGRLDALTHLSLAEMYLDRFEDSRRHAGARSTLSRATGQGDYLAPISAMLGTCSWVRGRTAEAVAVLEGAVEAARLLRTTARAVLVALQSLRRLFGSGIHGGGAGGRRGELGARALPRSRADPGARGLRTRAGAAQRRPGGARGRALSRGGGRRGASPDRWRVAGAVPRGVHACLARGGPAARRRACRRLGRDLRAGGRAALRPRQRRARARRRRSGRRAGGNATRWPPWPSSRVPAMSTMPPARAWPPAEGSRTPGGGGRPPPSSSAPRRTSAHSAPFGYRAEAERELRKLGRAVHRRSAAGTADDGIAALTERELQLARLVVDRKTNPEIAAELYLSVKTVETHLRNIFRKVGVSSRVELARAVEQSERGAKRRVHRLEPGHGRPGAG